MGCCPRTVGDVNLTAPLIEGSDGLRHRIFADADRRSAPHQNDRETRPQLSNPGVGEMSSEIDEKAAIERQPVLIDLALQGGGSHGAFTWGVLDRLLEEPWIKIEAISWTSAGAMNAAVLVDGWSRGGADGARTALDTYWRRVARAAAFSPLQRSPVERLTGRWTLDTSP